MRHSLSNMRRAALRLAGPLAAAALLAMSCAKAQPEFTGERAWSFLVEQCELGPRTPGSPGHARTRDLIITTLRDAGAAVTLQRFSVDDPYGDGEIPLTNITGSFYPKETKRVLLAAHYDTRPWADQEEDESLWSEPILGANDGASGVAVLLEIAGLLARHRPRGIGVDVVFFDGEDYGKEGDLQNYLLGSRHFAANLRGYRPTAAILLDMVGARDAKFGREGYSREYAPELTAAVFDRAREMGLVEFVEEPLAPIFDDHVPLLQAGIPAVDIIGLPYPHWHTLQDTPDKCSIDTLRSVGRLITDLVYAPPF